MNQELITVYVVPCRSHGKVYDKQLSGDATEVKIDKAGLIDDMNQAGMTEVAKYFEKNPKQLVDAMMIKGLDNIEENKHITIIGTVKCGRYDTHDRNSYTVSELVDY